MLVKKFLFCVILVLFILSACHKEVITSQNFFEKELNLPETAFDYTNVELPDHLTTNVLFGPGQNAATDNDNTPLNNPVTNEGATLGRVLFYDRKLSSNGTISCATCHQQENGFSDTAKLSKGFAGDQTRRHSMPLINARWYGRGRFF